MHVSRGVHGKSLYFLSCFCEPKTCPKTKNQKTLKRQVFFFFFFYIYLFLTVLSLLLSAGFLQLCEPGPFFVAVCSLLIVVVSLTVEHRPEVHRLQ